MHIASQCLTFSVAGGSFCSDFGSFEFDTLLQICICVDKDARWRWQYIPLSIKSGATVDARLDHQKAASDSMKNSGIKALRVLPHVCIKSKSSIFGYLGGKVILSTMDTCLEGLE